MPNFIKISLYSLALLAIGTGIGYYTTPTKVVEKVRVVEKQVVRVDRTTTTTEKPDGTKVTVVIDKTIETNDKASAIDKTTTRLNKDWMVSGAYLAKFGGGYEIVGGVQRRIIGDVYVGVFGSSSRSLGLGITYRF